MSKINEGALCKRTGVSAAKRKVVSWAWNILVLWLPLHSKQQVSGTDTGEEQVTGWQVFRAQKMFPFWQNRRERKRYDCFGEPPVHPLNVFTWTHTGNNGDTASIDIALCSLLRNVSCGSHRTTAAAAAMWLRITKPPPGVSGLSLEAWGTLHWTLKATWHIEVHCKFWPGFGFCSPTSAFCFLNFPLTHPFSPAS